MGIPSYFFKSLTALLLAVPVFNCTTLDTSERVSLTGDDRGGGGDCTFTQGFWKNHPGAWPVDSLQIGNFTYDNDFLIDILKTPVSGNGLIQLAHQLIAAKLNVANGADDTAVASSIAAADALIESLVLGEDSLPTSDTSALTEVLDRFNNSSGDTCEVPEEPCCGDGTVDAGEQCDDGNTTSGDGCSATCQLEEPKAPCCGDGTVDAGEQCDDGNTTGGDGCSATCQLEEPKAPCCGDGTVDAGEQCDDGNTVSGDGCSSTCQCEPVLL